MTLAFSLSPSPSPDEGSGEGGEGPARSGAGQTDERTGGKYNAIYIRCPSCDASVWPSLFLQSCPQPDDCLGSFLSSFLHFPSTFLLMMITAPFFASRLFFFFHDCQQREQAEREKQKLTQRLERVKKVRGR